MAIQPTKIVHTNAYLNNARALVTQSAHTLYCSPKSLFEQQRECYNMYTNLNMNYFLLNVLGLFFIFGLPFCFLFAPSSIVTFDLKLTS